jgi:hypothetical protein
MSSLVVVSKEVLPLHAVLSNALTIRCNIPQSSSVGESHPHALTDRT